MGEIKTLVATSAKPSPAAAKAKPSVRPINNIAFNLGANSIKGADTAKLTLIEFTDYQWGFCARHVRETYPQIEEEYIKTGKLRYAILDLPLRSHKSAFKAAMATHCAGEEGKFWEMHDRLMANLSATEPFEPHAEAIGLDIDAFDACLNSEKYAEAVRKDMAEARKAGATGTPSFVLARTDPNDLTTVKGLTFIRGAQPMSQFKTVIDSALASQ